MENEALAPEFVYGADVTWGNVGKDIVVSRFWEVYFNDTMKGPDEVLVQVSTINAVVDEDNPGIVEVTITPDAALLAAYPEALVDVDGKWYDIKVLDTPFGFNAAANHRISIAWSPLTLVETFLVGKAI